MPQQILAFSWNRGCALCDAPALAAGIAISGAVGQGGRNLPNDVRTIQDALNTMPPPNERPIPPLVVDGVVGPKTLAAINAYQRRHLGWCDGRVDPDGPTIHALNGGGGGIPAPAKAAAVPILPAATDAQNKTFIALVGTSLPTVRQWLFKALRTLDLAIDVNTDGRPPPIIPDLGLREYGLVDKYFHLAPLSRPQRVAYMQDLRRVFNDMQRVVSQSVIGDGLVGYGCGYFQPDPQDGKPPSVGYDAYTFYGGWHANGSGRPRMSRQDNYAGLNLREDTIFFPVSHYATRSRDYINMVLIHEMAHFVGPGVHSSNRIGDHSYRSKPGFDKIDAYTAKRTADCYACFAAEAALGRDPPKQ